MNVAFPALTPLPGPGYGLVFLVIVNGEQREWGISYEALCDAFGATSRHYRDRVAAFIAGRPRIEAAVRRLLPYRMNPLLLWQDFQPLPP